MKITHVVGARPNFMKAAPVIDALHRSGHFVQSLVHTGQHYDANMSDIFFLQLGLPQPDINLEVGAGTQTEQMAQIMVRFEEVIRKDRPDLILVYGDVTSTVAAALVSVRNNIRVGHVEAGLRSGDRAMPEEINRLLTDQMSDLLFTPSADGNENLAKEGIDASKVHLVGNVMIDTLVRLLPSAKTPIRDLPQKYVLVTLHRPSNVDDPLELSRIFHTLVEISAEVCVIFPVHPRTRARLADLGLISLSGGIRLTDPMGYLEFLGLQRSALAVVTDSGGIQEETTYLGVPCLTVRENTERPVTVELGSNKLVGRDMKLLQEELTKVLTGHRKKRAVPPLWEGLAGERIANVIAQHCLS